MIELERISAKELPLPKKNEFLWRYFDIHKFIDLIQTGKFRFTRMDQFEDPLEGIPISALLVYANGQGPEHLQNYSLSELILNTNLHNGLSKKLLSKLKQIHKIQKSAFVSCWFYEQHESMAMWNLYSNHDGVAVKITYGTLSESLKPDDSVLKIDDYYCGKVNYHPFNEVNPYESNESSKVKKVAFRKDSSYSHEKEIRFVVRSYKYTGELITLESKQIELGKLNMKVICHPRMNGWKKENIKRLLKSINCDSFYQESEIKLR